MILNLDPNLQTSTDNVEWGATFSVGQKKTDLIGTSGEVSSN